MLKLKNNIFYAWYWILVTLMLLFEVLYVMIWSKVGRNIDKHKSNTINRSFNDITAVSIVLSGLLYLTVIFCEFFNESIKTNLYVIWIMYVLISVAVLFNYLAVYNANIIEATNKTIPNIPAILSGAVEKENIPSKA